ncbi:holo-ACP synthase [Ammoniphilus sp. YIM 78166]|uniref:holo-ACP synthase n=1 Tax=Ammoniphilus sp. YIM 78166 TaxID=1644106 RepID=UPI00106F19AC|nr:holo-ACP synthase [Ammoniphilus sp. YIM 78166]
MIKGIGIDIVDKERMERILARQGERFLARILTEEERQNIPTGNRQIEFVAGRFAAKEAFAKATGFGFGRELSWQDIQITRDERGKPIIAPSTAWRAINDPEEKLIFHVSISHEKKYAVAQVIIEQA